MKCERCKENEASVFISKVVNGKKEEQMLCIDCAKVEKVFPVGIEGAVSVDSLLKGFFGVGQNIDKNNNFKNIICPICHMDLKKLAEKGRFGCSECYKVFGETALKTIRRVHARKKHVGKIPKRASGTLGLKRRLGDLRTKLEEHVIKEEYEEAAKLRDEIRVIEKEFALAMEENDENK